MLVLALPHRKGLSSMASDSSSADQQKAKTFFAYGNDAALKNNFDYAIEMYTRACKLAPDNLTYRQALRGIERRKYGNDPSKVGGLLGGARLQPSRIRIKSAKSKEQWTHVLEVCEEIFAQNPWDTGAAQDAADAAEQLGQPALAQWLLESVAAQGSNDAHFLRHMARFYERQHKFPQAIQCWEKVHKLLPYDEEASRQIRGLAASATILRSGLNEALTKTPEGTSGPESALAREAEELRQPVQTVEERCLQEIQENPQRVGPYLELADHYRFQDRLDEAEKILALGLKNNPDDGVLLTRHEEIQISRLRKALDAWTRKAERHPDNAEARAKVERFTKMLGEYQVKVYRRRLTQRPDDAQLHFELGAHLAQMGKHDEAIAEFQQARSSPLFRVQALLHAAMSFEANNIPKLAERNYNDALKALEATDPDDHATFNELHYRLGRLAETQGNLEAAESHYNEVAANDYSYRDVAQRLRSLNQIPPRD
jgi:tetratricopeptide (TPR) repeat protein